MPTTSGAITDAEAHPANGAWLCESTHGQNGEAEDVAKWPHLKEKLNKTRPATPRKAPTQSRSPP